MANGEYVAVKGDRIYVFNLITNEGFAFTGLGRSIEPVMGKYIITQVGSAQETDILSILGDSNKNESELYYMGKRAVISKTALSVYASVPKNLPKVNKIPLRVLRKEAPGVTQLLIPFSKGAVSFEELNNIFGELSWS